MEVKIMEWNINQRGRTGKTIPLWILDKVPDDINIIILTEFNCRAENINEFYTRMECMGFYYVTTNYSFKYANDIFIAIRDKGIRVESISYFKAYPDEPNSTCCIDWDSIPENLRIDVIIDNNLVTILGIRIKELKGDYDSRRIEMETVMKWVKEISNPIVILGDFNNLRDNTPIAEWNLNVLDNLLGSDFIRTTPTNHSWGLAYFNGQFDGYIKNDHIICKNISRCTVEQYDWNFAKHYRLDVIDKFGKQKLIIPVGEPDHGILFAKIEP
ncbi:endonuclease/exonuclease/phosphatase family protein [Macrococcoides caseolyticum]|uniref:endonuclease/exonuclease/phosphatase family protein n=1 Tax=Macrococcoides caseolyticum TaxID=69966 RepID=UPI00105C8841|nr:endonuclease/exonuclease/phosphatase family protein [Macrococcus caseolyticus]TDM16038.1 endonuclease/exonuclease/phosphatase family protein [Macrococcus caseolyticus]VUC73238.1 Uncharacterised protein [Macrococcus caseolyticus]